MDCLANLYSLLLLIGNGPYGLSHEQPSPINNPQSFTKLTICPSTYPNITVTSKQTTTTMDACTYVDKASSGCITMAKQTHKLHDARVDNFLSKWTDNACTSLASSDVFVSFYYVSATKKLSYLLLPVIKAGASNKDMVVGTASNSASSLKFYHINSSTIGDLFAMVPADMPPGAFPKAPDFSKTNNPELDASFPPDCNPLDKFKVVKFLTIFPLTYGSTAIKGKLTNDNIGDALRLVSKVTGLLWIKLILEWSKPLAGFVPNNPTALALLPQLKANQQWATQATIPSHGLTEDKEEDWKAIDTITTARIALQSNNTANPATSSVVVTSIPDNQSVLTTDSATKDITPTKRSPSRIAAASQLETRREKFRILFASYDQNSNTIRPPILTDTAKEIAATENATKRIGTLPSAIDHLLDIASTERDFLSRAVRWPRNLSNLSNLSKGQLAQDLFRTQLARSFEDTKDQFGFSILTLIPSTKGQGDKTDNLFLQEVELLLEETAKNSTKVDTTINVNTTVLPTTGTIVCANVSLLCRAFAHVQSTDASTHDSHPTPFLYSATIQLGTKRTS